MPHEEKGMLTLYHESLQSPLNVCSIWLRDHCRCSKCYGETFQRKCIVSEIPLDIHPKVLRTDNYTIYVTWSDGHESCYNILNIKEQLNASSKTFIKPIYWATADLVDSDYANVSLDNFLKDETVAKDVITSLIKFGCAFIKNVPTNIDGTEMAIKHLFPIQKTLFGEMWAFSDYKEHNDTAYTNEALPAHNDNTYFSDAAGLQVLHCVKRSGVGGENLLVDGFNAVKRLKESNRPAYDYLCKTIVPAEYVENGYHFKHSAPTIIVDPITNEPIQIRFNMNDRAFFNQIPQDEMLTFYKHYKALADEIQLAQNEWRFQLEPGTVCIFDNWRLLHGRSAYTGHRQMVGCYVARSEFQSVARRFGIIP